MNKVKFCFKLKLRYDSPIIYAVFWYGYDHLLSSGAAGILDILDFVFGKQRFQDRDAFFGLRSFC